jgi:prophage antirepressor-like protein
MVFQYEDNRQFRTFEIAGAPWFALVDVCRALDIKNPSDVAGRLDVDEKMTLDLTEGHSAGRGGARAMTIINESGLYSVILRSDKPEAKRFKKWVTAEVLPSIRRTGAYGRTPRFIRRYNDNWDRVDEGHFSIISELAIRLWGRLEQVGHVMADVAADGTELRPDVSVGRLLSQWLREFHPEVCDNYTMYMHKTAQAEFEARQYPYDMLPLYIEFVDTVWIPKHSERYFKTRDPAALPHLPKLLPTPRRPRLISSRQPPIRPAS